MSSDQASRHLRVIAIIPAYNEENSVRRIVKDASRFVDEILVVDDGSEDMTAKEAESAGATTIKHHSNSGIGSSLRTGYGYCLSKPCDIVVQLDADRQHDPQFVPLMINHMITNNLDIVTGSRFLGQRNDDHALPRRAGIKLFSVLASSYGPARITDVTSGFRAYRTTALRLIGDVADRHWSFDQTLRALKLGLKYGEYPVLMPKRNSGKSQFSARTFFLYPPRMTGDVLKIALSGSQHDEAKMSQEL